MVRLASSRRSPSMSNAARRRKMRLSQNSTCEKNSRCWQPACSRSVAVKKGALLESDAVLAHAVGQPVVLIEADTSGEWKVRADAHEHPSPVSIVDVKVVLQ